MANATEEPSFRPPKVSEMIAAQLRRQIIGGQLQEDDSLPPEAALLEQFDVSRPTLREAFRVLESERLITVHRGARGGARIRTPSGDAAARYAGLILEHRGVTLKDVLEARSAIEPGCVGLLAVRRTARDLRTLRRRLAESEQLEGVGPEQIRSTSGDFHLLLAELVGNRTLTLVNEMLHLITRRATIKVAAANRQQPAVDEVWETARDEHHEVVRLIEARDRDGATALWRSHLDEVAKYLLANHGATTVLDLLDQYDSGVGE